MTRRTLGLSHHRKTIFAWLSSLSFSDIRLKNRFTYYTLLVTFVPFCHRNSRTCTAYLSHGGKVHLLSYASSNESMRVAKHDQFRKIYHHSAKDVAPPFSCRFIVAKCLKAARLLVHRFNGCVSSFSLTPACRVVYI